ncbi:hypothetical protein [Prosthecobacter vanneervenii]|uniref:Uncharacterized protein n=1 Tax=Prosthecobacter vanneervenii TaxID=48466 RepID=A0A7W7Y7T6_9BACT|nr:hypothetical protein [Prosthecobacter vanneervenii]MBB5031228.1 hypothetical protein [Prosthecobacter vanneervenii]
MTTAVIAAAAPAPAAFSQPLPVTPPASSMADVDRLRALVAGVQPVSGTSTPPVNQAAQAEQGGFRTLGDSILEGVSKFNLGYNDSLNGITTKIEEISRADPLQLGNDFGQIMSLQIEIARWTMSVMGVDNASKAGTNTIKELSKGG